MNYHGYSVIRLTDDLSVFPYLYTDELSGELPFFAKVHPRWMLHLYIVVLYYTVDRWSVSSSYNVQMMVLMDEASLV